jgi:uncharacterized membrane protein YedE/YeeE
MQQANILRLYILASRRASVASCSPRTPTTLNWFSKYDGNLLGCALLGTGMALTGSCPGTVFVQVGMGLRSGFEVLFGSVIGGILFTGWGSKLKRQVVAAKANSAANGNGEVKKSKPVLTVQDALHTPELPTVAAYSALCIAVVSLVMKYLPDSQATLLNPLLGGTLMGLSQLSSLVLTGNTLGVSGSFEAIGKIFWKLVGGSPADRKEGKKASWPSVTSLFFAGGIALGSFLYWHGPAPHALPPVGSIPVTTGRAVLGGLLMAFGSRVAGGCTSGHGISGMSMLSLASVASVASMFGVGIAVGTGLKAVGL